MAKIIWNESLSVKIADIDAQHEKLINFVNELDVAMNEGKRKEVVSGIFCSLVQYTQTHFAAEERLLAALGFPNLPAHHSEHEKLLVKLMEIREKFQTGRLNLTVPVMSFLNAWLIHHIQVMDMEYSDFLISKGEH